MVKALLSQELMGYKILEMKRVFKELELGDRDEDYLLVTREGDVLETSLSIIDNSL